jgi:hypothetical protein
MATSNLTSNVVGIDEKVKASAGDATAGTLDAKVDGTTITVTGDQLVRAALTGDVTTVGNAATVVGGNADTVTTNANLTGDVTSVGNATTNVTNANLTGIVTSVGNATAIADGAIAPSKIADGTDGELLTWDAAGVIDTVAAGTATHVLTSNGAGAAPTFQAPAGGGATTLIASTSPSNTTVSGDMTIVADRRYLLEWFLEPSTSTAFEPVLRFNNNATNDYNWTLRMLRMIVSPTEVTDGEASNNGIRLFAQNAGDIRVHSNAADGYHRGYLIINTNDATGPNRDAYVQGQGSYNGNDGNEYSCWFGGSYQDVAVTSVEIASLGGNFSGEVRLYEFANA